MITLPAVRFVRCYDPNQCRMRNIWMSVTTQDQLNNEPQATEITVTAQTVEVALIKIRKLVDEWIGKKWIDAEAVAEIEKASKKLVDAKDSIYEVI